MVDAAVAGSYRNWENQALSRLALIVVLDQFNRNIHRGRAGAFDGAARALRLALDALDHGMDREVDPIARGFFYLWDRGVELERGALVASRRLRHLGMIAVGFCGVCRHQRQALDLVTLRRPPAPAIGMESRRAETRPRSPIRCTTPRFEASPIPEVGCGDETEEAASSALPKTRVDGSAEEFICLDAASTSASACDKY